MAHPGFSFHAWADPSMAIDQNGWSVQDHSRDFLPSSKSKGLVEARRRLDELLFCIGGETLTQLQYSGIFFSGQNFRPVLLAAIHTLRDRIITWSHVWGRSHLGSLTPLIEQVECSNSYLLVGFFALLPPAQPGQPCCNYDLLFQRMHFSKPNLFPGLANHPHGHET